MTPMLGPIRSQPDPCRAVPATPMPRRRPSASDDASIPALRVSSSLQAPAAEEGERHLPSDPYEDWDAAYVLGALESREHQEYETHLRTCTACADAVGQTHQTMRILRRIGPESARWRDD